MLHELILLVIGIFGFSAAGYLDLRYTEFPDWLPYSMIILALLVWGGVSFLAADFSFLINSAITGIVFLGIGLLLYFTKQWGDGDAWLLGAFGFLFHQPLKVFSATVQSGIFPYPAVALFNFFITGFVYLVVYSIALGILNKKETIKFFMQAKKQKGKVYIGIVLIFIYSIFAHYFYSILIIPNTYFLYLPLFMAFIYVFMLYGRFVEQKLFKKKISVKKLRIGDVLVKNRWRGLTEKEVRALQKKGGSVWIKEGVRFAPVFVLTLLVTMLYGSLVGLFV